MRDNSYKTPSKGFVLLKCQDTNKKGNVRYSDVKMVSNRKDFNHRIKNADASKIQAKN